ncbi:hypothetical protein Pedsa_2661 [Pseudopedobacter saltans DSM 12145]|uniref:Uncharacterized protein n=1 Tax=Pseudopedobacter saltans (strain ATCC 51119 / DSM 12145 / JCM 21818 / CCUG 39354 / LMG 10337 / NBRC 100064 / NCIMB 13643) TaxID=762903 RepID=F0S689_PSESL|nr:hypothetical protein Pedsa_2661 [Pseudopedobacter saltans DSM 12145]
MFQAIKLIYHHSATFLRIRQTPEYLIPTSTFLPELFGCASGALRQPPNVPRRIIEELSKISAMIVEAGTNQGASRYGAESKHQRSFMDFHGL